MIGNGLRYRSDAPAMLTAIARAYGDVAFARIGPTSFYLLSNPDLAHDVLERSEDHFERIAGMRRVNERIVHEAVFASEGAAHAEQRRVLEPVMFHEAPRTHAGTVVRYARRMAESWRDGAELEVVAEAEHTTRDMLVEVLFGLDPAEPDGRRLADAVLATNDALNAILLGATPLGDRLPTRGRSRFRRRLAELDVTLADLARRRIDEGLTGDDVLTMFLRAGDPALSPELARDHALSQFRGHLGAGALLGWAWFLLSQQPGAAERLELEADALGRDPAAADDLRAIPWAMAVAHETLRLYPPAWLLARRTTADHRVDGTTIPAGSRVLISPWILHHYPRWWNDPEVFRPDRFEDPFRNADRLAPGYLALGLGSKRCLGIRFLPMEVALVVATVARRWRLELRPGHPVEPLAKATLRPKHGIAMIVRARNGGRPATR